MMRKKSKKRKAFCFFFCFLILMLKAANLRCQGSFWLGPSSPLHCDMLHLHCALHCEILCYAFCYSHSALCGVLALRYATPSPPGQHHFTQIANYSRYVGLD